MVKTTKHIGDETETCVSNDGEAGVSVIISDKHGKPYHTAPLTVKCGKPNDT